MNTNARRAVTLRGIALAVTIGTLTFGSLPAAHGIVLHGKPTFASYGYSTTPTTSPFSGVTLSDVKINGGQLTAPVAKGSTVTVSGNFVLDSTGCGGCQDQIQFGIANAPGTLGCIYDGFNSDSGPFSTTFTAPTRAGTYVLGFDRSEQLSCLTTWTSGAPNNDYTRWFAVIRVQ